MSLSAPDAVIAAKRIKFVVPNMGLGNCEVCKIKSVIETFIIWNLCAMSKYKPQVKIQIMSSNVASAEIFRQRRCNFAECRSIPNHVIRDMIDG